MPLKCQQVINKNKLAQKYLTSTTWKVLKKENYICTKIMNWIKYHYTMNGYANICNGSIMTQGPALAFYIQGCSPVVLF